MPSTVGLGVLRVVTSAAEHQPVVIVVDDAAGVDEATRSAISFTLTRLGIDQVGAFLGLPVAASPWDAVVTERIVLGRLGTADLVAIVRAAVDCDDQVAEACAGWSAGSPLLALELARSLSVDERRGPLAAAEGSAATGRAVDRLQDRLDAPTRGGEAGLCRRRRCPGGRVSRRARRLDGARRAGRGTGRGRGRRRARSSTAMRSPSPTRCSARSPTTSSPRRVAAPPTAPWPP